MKIYLPDKVKFIIDEIYNEGYEAFIVGGCVRDSILGIEPHDYDITTNAKPEEIKRIFNVYKIIDNGIKHGTVGVIIDKEVYEITTYRIEGEYEKNRRPKDVEFTSNIVDDLKRRDFTINAMAYNDKVGLVDKFNGIKDLETKIIKTVGNPDERFKEDGLRIIRAIRFSSKLNFKIENKTLRSIYKNANILENISKERITDEFTKILLSNNPQKIILLYDTKIFNSIGIYNYKFKDINQIEKNLVALKECNVDIEERLALLEYIISFDEVSRIGSNEIENSKYYEKNIKDRNIVNKLIYPKSINKECNIMIGYMFKNIEQYDSIEIKHILNKIGPKTLIKILKLKNMYNNCCLREKINNSELNKKSEIIDSCIDKIIRIEENKECYLIKDLDINGDVLKQLGYEGKEIGRILNLLLEDVIKNPNLNKKKNLINLLQNK